MQNAADAEDCTEDVFVKAMSAEFNDEKHERAWLTVTAKNLCRDRLKHWWRKKTEPPLSPKNRISKSSGSGISGSVFFL